MGDHFVLLVDRLLIESTLEAAIESLNLSRQTTTLGTEKSKLISLHIVECRICQDEDEDSNMETRCSCCGSLKPFEPGYTAPPPMFQLGSIPMNFRYFCDSNIVFDLNVFIKGNWEISRRDPNNPCFIAMVTTEPNFVDPDYDEYAAFESRSLFCCHSVAAIFMVLLILRHTLPILVNGAQDYSFPLFLLLLLRTTGIIVPINIMVKAVNAIKCCQRQRTSPERPGRVSSRSVHMGSLQLRTLKWSRFQETLTGLPKATCPSSPKLPRLGNLGTIGEGHFVSTPARPIKDRPLLTMISSFENIVCSYSGLKKVTLGWSTLAWK
ncbi:hypothetical protein HYC85_030898 [Camellia sinensis]|uniref:RING-CH-type domain-containing protein n=1 Tax=Camellia sinensis TaxID=4442 RepID=A0A7J7FPI4_CAMSI|nr:hypothetical protein HYC85_030898 [Camellia sinensis]